MFKYSTTKKTINKITARQTRASLCKHDVIKACSIKYLTKQIELVLPTFFQRLDRSQNHRIFDVRATTILYYNYRAFEISITVQQFTFFDPHCTRVQN